MRILALLFLATLTMSSGIHAQSLAGYTTTLNYFYIFHDGQTDKIEHQEIRNFKVGGSFLAWNDNTGNFKVWDDGEIIKLQDGFVTDYDAKSYLLVYRMKEQLKAYVDGKRYLLGNGITQYAVGDSLVVWYDRFTQRFNGFYEGEVVALEDGLIGQPVISVKVSDNIAAWVNPRQYLKVWYQGEVMEMLYGDPGVRYDVGRDILAYFYRDYNTFNIFYKGNDYELGAWSPQSFKAGDGIVAYVNDVGEFRVFYEGQDLSVSAFAPDYYEVVDDLVIYHEQDMFKVFKGGNKTTLETYIPEVVQVRQGNIVYMDITNRLKGFLNGEQVQITNEIVNSFLLGFSTVHYHQGVNDNRVWWDGKSF